MMINRIWMPGAVVVVAAAVERFDDDGAKMMRVPRIADDGVGDVFVAATDLVPMACHNRISTDSFGCRT